ncbi:ABC transporter permease [Rhizobiales bacterium]|uniref:ABC transporter permease n=1 Tax=Hongsoonwoonella zoysiae TaxID=2821844 RepID=UPI001561379A|nr:ABC transporter permease [Hongsoonwoonella zoysiae]NRG18545.1 ABC transporter permease [Hongsoonwoonella zoysiae]
MSAALRTHFRVIAALVIREMTTRYGNKIGGYIWAIVDPVAFIALMSIVFSAIAHSPPIGRSFVLFYASGYMAFWIYRSMTDQVSQAAKSNRALLNYPIVSPFDTFVARAALQGGTQLAVCVLIFSGIAVFITPLHSLDFQSLITASLVAITLGVGIGMLNSVLFRMSEVYQQVFNIINRPLFIVSGVFFLPESIPHPYQDYLLWNPVSHIIGWFRRGIYPSYRAAFVDEAWLIGIAIAALFTGLLITSAFKAKLREVA